MQNAKLKRILRELTELDANDEHLAHGESVRSQRELSPAQFLLNQAVNGRAKHRQQQQSAARHRTPPLLPRPSVSIKSVLITPTPTWTTLVDSSVYETVVTTHVETEVPIILRGSRVKTTIVETSTQTGQRAEACTVFRIFLKDLINFSVTATEFRTSSTLITPTATWDTVAVTITPTVSSANPASGRGRTPGLPTSWSQVKVQGRRPLDPRTGAGNY